MNDSEWLRTRRLHLMSKLKWVEGLRCENYSGYLTYRNTACGYEYYLQHGRSRKRIRTSEMETARALAQNLLVRQLKHALVEEIKAIDYRLCHPAVYEDVLEDFLKNHPGYKPLLDDKINFSAEEKDF